MCRGRATVYLSAARNMEVVVLSASCAVSYQAVADFATPCLPSRLSRVRAPSPAPISSITSLQLASQAVSQASIIIEYINTVGEIRTYDL